MATSTAGNEEDHFSTKHLAVDLKRLSVRGGAATFAGQGTKFVMQFASTVILARLLTPADFGLIAMVMAVTGFIMVFKDLGLSMATVQRAEINYDQVSTLFWVNVAISIILMLVTLSLAPAVAWFYNDSRLIAITSTLSIAFIFGGLTVQHQALLRRQMRLAAVAIIDVAAMAAGILTAVFCAWVGFGYWALVWMQVATAGVNAVGVWIANGWRPGWPVRHSGVRAMLRFGGYLTGFSFVNYFARNLDNVLIGYFCGAQPLGLYSKSYSLLLLPIGQIVAPMTSVAVPALSKLQHEPESYRRYYLKALGLIAYFTFPLVTAIAVLSTELVNLFLGAQWLDAVPIFTILAVAALFQPVGSTVGWIYVSLGQTRRMFVWICIAAPLIVLSFLIGLRWGPVGVASCYAICNIVLFYPQFAFALKFSPIRVRDAFLILYHPLVLSIIMGLAMTVVRIRLVGLGLIWTISVTIAAGVIAILLIAIGLNSIRADIRGIWVTVKTGLLSR